MILYDDEFIAFNTYSWEIGYIRDSLDQNQWYYYLVDSYSGNQITDLDWQKY